MKLQALGWLAAGVLAAGLNSSYHNGGLEWAHQIADQVSHETNTVFALATGNADRLYAETRLRQVRMARVGEENSSPCRFSLAMAKLQPAVPFSQVALAQFERVSDQEQAQADRLAARRARMQAQFERVEVPEIDVPEIQVPEVQVPAFRVSEIRVPAVRVPAIHIPAVHVQPVVVNVPNVLVCPRVRVSIPRIPEVKVPPIPSVHVEFSDDAGPV
ncbi:MAG TPA: hypothetical protein VGG04_18405 [Candidatus Sulfotelmatobacter sp.]|jgi:hypothetical protein